MRSHPRPDSSVPSCELRSRLLPLLVRSSSSIFVMQTFRPAGFNASFSLKYNPFVRSISYTSWCILKRHFPQHPALHLILPTPLGSCYFNHLFYTLVICRLRVSPRASSTSLLNHFTTNTISNTTNLSHTARSPATIKPHISDSSLHDLRTEAGLAPTTCSASGLTQDGTWQYRTPALIPQRRIYLQSIPPPLDPRRQAPSSTLTSFKIRIASRPNSVGHSHLQLLSGDFPSPART